MALLHGLLHIHHDLSCIEVSRQSLRSALPVLPSNQLRACPMKKASTQAGFYGKRLLKKELLALSG